MLILENRDAAQERNDHLQNLRSATDGFRPEGVRQVEARLSGSQLNARLNVMPQQAQNVFDLAKTPQGRQALNIALSQLGAGSFRAENLHWAGNNPVLANRAFALAKNIMVNGGGQIPQSANRPSFSPNASINSARAHAGREPVSQYTRNSTQNQANHHESGIQGRDF
jgi:hypothetical protein